MGIVDRLTGKRETYTTTGNREIPKGDVKEFVLKVLDGGSWQIPPLGGIERRSSPIHVNEIQDIEQFEGVRCDMLGKDGRIIGQYWKHMDKKKTGSAFEGLEELTDTLEEFNSLKDRLGNALYSTGADSEIKELLQAIVVNQQSGGGGNDMLAEMERMKEFMDNFDKMKGMFGGTSTNDYPTWLKALSDPNVVKGINETVGSLARTAGEEFQATQNVQQPPPSPHPEQPQPSPSKHKMEINEFSPEEKQVDVEETEEMEKKEKTIEEPKNEKEDEENDS